MSPEPWEIEANNLEPHGETHSHITDANGRFIAATGDDTMDARAIAEVPEMIRMLKQFEIDLLLWPDSPMKQNRASKIKGLLDRIEGSDD